MPRYVPLARRGFTLVELLVVIAIISTLMGLLLPAVQNAREASRRNACSNNISQLSKAVVSYDGAKGALPGWKNKYPGSSGTIIGVSWTIPILPQIERGDVYRAWESASAMPVAPSPMIPTISLFQCPSSPPSDSPNETIAYAANAGSCQSMGAVAVSGTQAKGDAVFLDTIGALGAISYTSARNSLDVVSGADGTTNTIMFSEKCSSLATQAKWCVQPVATGTSSMDWTLAAASPVFGIPGLTFSGTASPTRVINAPAETLGNYGMPSSTHPSGVVVSFCDGHVIYMKDSIAPHVYAQLITSDSKWRTSPTNEYYTNSPRVNAWIKTFSTSAQYLLNEEDLR